MSHHIRGLSDGERAILQQDGDDGDEGPRVLGNQSSVARKHYTCDTCKVGSIAPGETYHRLVTLGDEGFQIERFCSNPEPAKEPGTWHCEAERLQIAQYHRDAYVSELTADGTMTEAQASDAYDRHLAEQARDRQAHDAEAAARRAASAAQPRGNDEDLPF
jgi:hypothetical protein